MTLDHTADAGSPDPTSPIDAGSFGSRLLGAIGRTPVRALARETGISEGVLRKYLSNDSDPSRTRLIALAKAADVSLEWLATGLGPMAAEAIPQDAARESPGDYNADQPAPGAVDKQRLQVAIETAETILQCTVKDVTTAQKAAFIIALYNYLPAGEISQQTRDNVVKLFEAIT